MFLASGLVPAYTAAAFAKRFARLALTASPAGLRLLTDVTSCHSHPLEASLHVNASQQTSACRSHWSRP